LARHPRWECLGTRSTGLSGGQPQSGHAAAFHTCQGTKARLEWQPWFFVPHHALDLVQLYTHVSENLPPYARPRFLRLQESLATTETFKPQKVQMANEGFDPSTLMPSTFWTKLWVPTSLSHLPGIAPSWLGTYKSETFHTLWEVL
jgi:hypothetical protein